MPTSDNPLATCADIACTRPSAVCEPDHFRDDDDLCVHCSNEFSMINLRSVRSWLPFATLLSLALVILLGLCCFSRCIWCVQKVARSKRLGQAVVTANLLVQQRAIWVPKLKVILNLNPS